MPASPTSPEEGRHSCRPAFQNDGQKPPSSSIHPRPIHRSKTLWAGILVLTFLTWAWWDSLHRWNSITYRDYTLAHADSGLCLTHWNIGKNKPLAFPHGKIPPTNKTWAHPRLDAPHLFRSTHHDTPDLFSPTGISVETTRYFTHDPENFELTPRNSAAQHFSSLIFSPAPGTWGLFLPHWLLIAIFLIPWSAYLISRSRRIRRLTKPAE